MLLPAPVLLIPQFLLWEVSPRSASVADRPDEKVDLVWVTREANGPGRFVRKSLAVGSRMP